jgi:hypothetical protein
MPTNLPYGQRLVRDGTGGRTHMKDILSPYAIFATMGLSERNWKRRLRTAYGRGNTRTQNVTICGGVSVVCWSVRERLASAARSMNVSE